MKNDEIKQANRKALPKFLLFAVACVLIGGLIGYASGYGERSGRVLWNAYCPVADAGDSGHRAGGLHPDLSARKETGRCVG